MPETTLILSSESAPIVPVIGSASFESEAAWVRPVVVEAARWLWRSYGSNTATAYANHLGLPRAEQRWRPASGRNQHRAGASRLAFFPYCLTAGLDPRADMTREALQAWLTAMDAEQVPKTTQQARFGAVSAWYSEQRYHGRSRFEPAAALPQTLRRNAGIVTPTPASPTVPLTMEHVRALRIAADEDPGRCRLRNRALVAVLTTTGIRAGELCGLSRADLHPAGPDGHPALWIFGKGGKHRWVPLAPMAQAALDEYLDARNSDATDVAVYRQTAGRREPMFTTVSGRRLEPQHVTGVLRYLCRALSRTRASSSRVRQAAAALRPVASTVHPHQVRHFYAVTAEGHGAPLRQITKDLGHASPETTVTYLDHVHDLANSAAGAVADLITAMDP